MSQPVRVARQIAAPRATKVLAEILGLGVLAQAAFAGGFLGGHHMWLSWHQRLGDFIVVIPLVSLIVGLVARRRRPDTTSMLLIRVVLVALVIGTEAAGHAAGSLLALHIPLAVAVMALTMWQITIAAEAQGVNVRRPHPARAEHGRS
jgi:hypothetical protein